MVSVKKIKLIELQEFVNSSDYHQLINKPISLARVISYLNNPNANDDDVVLYMAFVELELIGYKTIFADTFFYNNCKTKFGWLSGTWTHKNYRRKGVSTLLLNEVLSDWDENLMYTNYAEESKAVYDKTDKFTLLKSNEGYRYYIRFCFKELLPPKSDYFSKNIKILKFVDVTLNLLGDFRFKLLNTKKNSDYAICKLEDWNDKIINFIEPFKKKELFQRDKILYDWIAKYPWVKTDVETEILSQQYYFSNFSTKFCSNWYKIYEIKSQKIIGIALITINNKHLKTPYIYATSDSLPFFKNLIIKLCIKHKISYLTVYNADLNKLILEQSYFKILSKKFTQNYFYSKKLAKQLPSIGVFEIQNGDGDIVFT
ncbi:GNAT family N-acetyltransferase [Lutibacter sp.]|uniref:GNAT family N-acetyltransferase n=1 Tax=Lutibacter sp. TaxID=1925666 RepID=UPI00356480A9